MTRGAVFLDRDGVLNRAPVKNGAPQSPRRIEDVEILPGVPEALQQLRAAGFRLIVVTNQPDVARGTLAREFVDAIHARLQSALPLHEFRVCYHDDADECDCRKPKPGMLLEAAHDAGLDLAASFLVGDRWRDIEAGHRAGCRTALVDHGYAEPDSRPPDVRVKSLVEAAAWILRCSGVTDAS